MQIAIISSSIRKGRRSHGVAHRFLWLAEAIQARKLQEAIPG